MISIHDNNVYAYVVDCERQRLTLHTEFRDREPHEFTDVVFVGLVAHFFENVLEGNILFDVEEIEAGMIVDDDAELFTRSWRYSWPGIEYKGDLVALKAELTAMSIRGFQISSSYGVSGWVLSQRCERISRELRADVTTA
jgi:hypothetical protein